MVPKLPTAYKVPHEPLTNVVELLPKQIATLIKNEASLMFSLLRKLNKKEASLALNDKEIIKKETGDRQ
jgi:hypothetical protein